MTGVWMLLNTHYANKHGVQMCLRLSSWQWVSRTGGTNGLGAYSRRDADENQHSCNGRRGLRAAVFSALNQLWLDATVVTQLCYIILSATYSVLKKKKPFAHNQWVTIDIGGKRRYIVLISWRIMIITKQIHLQIDKCSPLIHCHKM